MAGTFRPGDCLIVESIPLADIGPGDIVIYRGGDRAVAEEAMVHRVIAVTPGGLITRGDNNAHMDEAPVTGDNLIGRVARVERDGKAQRVHGGWWGLLRARIRYTRNRVVPTIRRVIIRPGRRPYGWLRESGLVAHLWRPSIVKLRLTNKNGSLLKFVHKGRTVATWWFEPELFHCHRPYDLVIWREYLALKRRADL
jgi:hypothetical protein